jgi:hypothetical protein
VSPTGGVGNGDTPYTYTINPNIGMQPMPGEFTGLSAGTYTITATNSNSYTAATVVSIVAPPALTISTSFVNAPCIPGTGSASATGAGGTPFLGSYLYTWYDASNTAIDFDDSVGVLLPGTYTVTAEDGNACLVNSTVTITLLKGTKLAAKVLLAGNYNATSMLMTDDLRALNLIPTVEPYSSGIYTSAFSHVGGGGSETTTAAALAVTGNNAIVDWVFIQLRDKTNNNIVLHTKSALLQRDGDIVDVDGTSAVNLSDVCPDDYFVTIKHRNHVGVMTAGVMSFAYNATTSVDFTNTSTALFVRPAPNANNAPLTGATRIMGGRRALYAGNAGINPAAIARFITYNASVNSDRYKLLEATGPTGTISGYSVFDCDLNGTARFNGITPDRLVILNNCNNSNTIIVHEQTPN